MNNQYDLYLDNVSAQFCSMVLLKNVRSTLLEMALRAKLCSTKLI